MSDTNMTHQEAFFFTLRAAAIFYKYADPNVPDPTGDELRVALLYSKYIAELEESGGEEL
jgi:hypothetical protein